ncbi:unnamed protein product, partial [Ectocarpus sp. 13 AM-2016]
HAHLLVLAAAKRGRRERQCAVLTVATWRVVLRSFSDGDELEDEGLGGGPPVKRTRRVLPRPDYRPYLVVVAHAGRDGPQGTNVKRGQALSEALPHPLPVLHRVMELVKKKKWFPMRKKDVAGRMYVHPSRAEVLSSLHILGRGNFFEDISQASHISDGGV